MATDDPGMEGAFKTPSLRNVALRAPYMHAGQLASLDQVVQHYVRSPAAVVGHSELAQSDSESTGRRPIRLTEAEMQDVVTLLSTLSGPVVERAPR